MGEVVIVRGLGIEMVLLVAKEMEVGSEMGVAVEGKKMGTHLHDWCSHFRSHLHLKWGN